MVLTCTEEELGECSEALEVYQLWGRDLPRWSSHCSGRLELLPLKAVCLRTHLVGPSVTCRLV